MIRNLSEGKCFNVFEQGGELFVTFSVEGKIYKQNLKSGEKSFVGFGDEYLPIYSNLALIRRGQNYKILGEKYE